MSQNPGSHNAQSQLRQWQVALAALGVVYGDIGTSPLYAIKESFGSHYQITPTELNLLGILSLMLWALVMMIVVKFMIFVTRADNHGEGGILALLALVMPKNTGIALHKSRWFIFLGLIGCALLYGDGMITPAISVLSAVEGLGVATPLFEAYVVPISICILIGLFWAQKRGTATIGSFFGPIILIWFLAIAAAGIPWIIKYPYVLKAMNPYYAFQFFVNNGFRGFWVLGSVVLCVTGGEAMYADMGHFGRRPIQRAWYLVVLPCLIINYFGQGALILSQQNSIIKNPFFELIPRDFLYPMVILATMAAVIASQALITGVYSLTHQATQLGYLPRFNVIHTSEETEGQIYMPEINRIMMVCCVGLVAMFKSSSNLAAAYGIAVTGTMICTALLFFLVTRKIWKWPLSKSIPLVALFLLVDLSFFASNIVKFFEGGWFPILVAGCVLIIMFTWREGRNTLSQAMMKKAAPLEAFIRKLKEEKPYRVEGTAMVMTANRDVAPPVLLHHLRHNKVMHKQVILLTVQVRHTPFVTPEHRLEVTPLEEGLVRVIAHYGYIQRPNVSEIIRLLQKFNVEVDKSQMSFYLGRETLLPSGPSRMAIWRKELFAFLSKNSQTATSSFRIPPDQVVEIGLQLEI